jgi:hypothetical protein
LRHRFTATLTEIIYLGDQIRARLDVVGNPNLMAKTSIAHWDSHLRVGDSRRRIAVGESAGAHADVRNRSLAG